MDTQKREEAELAICAAAVKGDLPEVLRLMQEMEPGNLALFAYMCKDLGQFAMAILSGSPQGRASDA